MADDPLARWHEVISRGDPALLDALIANDAVFFSPAVHSAQIGKPLVVKYLTAAMAVLSGPAFRYVGEWRGARSAVLEFETDLDGIHVNGIDMIDWNEAGQITRFKVMVRPMKGLHHVVERMARQLGLSA